MGGKIATPEDRKEEVIVEIEENKEAITIVKENELPRPIEIAIREEAEEEKKEEKEEVSIEEDEEGRKEEGKKEEEEKKRKEEEEKERKKLEEEIRKAKDEWRAKEAIKTSMIIFVLDLLVEKGLLSYFEKENEFILPLLLSTINLFKHTSSNVRVLVFKLWKSIILNPISAVHQGNASTGGGSSGINIKTTTSNTINTQIASSVTTSNLLSSQGIAINANNVNNNANNRAAAELLLGTSISSTTTMLQSISKEQQPSQGPQMIVNTNVSISSNTILSTIISKQLFEYFKNNDESGIMNKPIIIEAYVDTVQLSHIIDQNRERKQRNDEEWRKLYIERILQIYIPKIRNIYHIETYISIIFHTFGETLERQKVRLNEFQQNKIERDRRVQRQWKSLVKRMTHERAIWKIPRKVWKLDSTEGLHRMRKRLKPSTDNQLLYYLTPYQLVRGGKSWKALIDENEDTTLITPLSMRQKQSDQLKHILAQRDDVELKNEYLYFDLTIGFYFSSFLFPFLFFILFLFYFIYFYSTSLFLLLFPFFLPFSFSSPLPFSFPSSSFSSTLSLLPSLLLFFSSFPPSFPSPQASKSLLFSSFVPSHFLLLLSLPFFLPFIFLSAFPHSLFV